MKKGLIRGFLAALITGVILIPPIMMPPVWKLQDESITVTRWLKSGKTKVTVGPDQSGWTPVSTVSRHVLHAIITSEDARFEQHRGLDFREIRLSLRTNLEKGRIVRGGSTITQQVVKVAFLSRQKSIIRKAREALGALLLEQLLDKERILEWYINLVEFGGGVYGIAEAAHQYFDTEPRLLTIQQGVNLALVLPGPNTWSRGLQDRRLTAFGQKRYATIVNQMYQNGYITKTLRKTALATGDFGEPVEAWYDEFGTKK